MTDPLARFADLPRDAEGKVTLSDEEWRARLSEQEYMILRQSGTEMRGTGPLTNHEAPGNYHCAGCGLHLYSSEHKFHSGCGWPAFDNEIPGTVDRHEDVSMGMKRVEITCSNCGGHLGHVFEGEGFTKTNQRHCVNSVSITFVGKDGNEIKG